MQNDPDLMQFNSWRAVQPDAEDAGLVLTASDHASKSCSVWWAGPETDFLDRMRAEARARGITLIVKQAKYSKQERRRTTELIFQGKTALEQAGFELASVSGPTPDFQGFTVRGAPLGDQEVQHLTPELVASARDAVAILLREAVVPIVDIRIEYGRWHPF